MMQMKILFLLCMVMLLNGSEDKSNHRPIAEKFMESLQKKREQLKATLLKKNNLRDTDEEKSLMASQEIEKEKSSMAPQEIEKEKSFKELCSELFTKEKCKKCLDVKRCCNGFKKDVNNYIEKYKDIYGSRKFFRELFGGKQNKYHGRCSCFLISWQLWPVFSYLFNLIAPAFLDIREAYFMSMANFILIGSGYCFVHFEFVWNYLFNSLLVVINAILLGEGFALHKTKDAMTSHGGGFALTSDGGEFQITNIEKILQGGAIVTASLVAEFARSYKIITSPQRKFTWDAYILDNNWFFLLTNLILTLAVHPHFFWVSIAIAFTACCGCSDKYALGISFMINSLLVLSFGAYPTWLRYEIGLPVGAVGYCARQSYMADRQEGY